MAYNNLNTGRILYVSKLRGNDDTAQVGNPARPWINPWSVRSIVTSGDTIIIRKGEYTIGNIGDGADVEYDDSNHAAHTLFIDGVTYIFEPGATIKVICSSTAVIPFYNDVDGVSLKVVGKGEFISTEDQGSIFYNVGEATSVVFEGDRMESHSFGGSCFLSYGDLDLRIRYWRSENHKPVDMLPISGHVNIWIGHMQYGEVYDGIVTQDNTWIMFNIGGGSSDSNIFIELDSIDQINSDTGGAGSSTSAILSDLNITMKVKNWRHQRWAGYTTKADILRFPCNGNASGSNNNLRVHFHVDNYYGDAAIVEYSNCLNGSNNYVLITGNYICTGNHKETILAKGTVAMTGTNNVIEFDGHFANEQKATVSIPTNSSVPMVFGGSYKPASGFTAIDFTGLPRAGVDMTIKKVYLQVDDGVAPISGPAGTTVLAKGWCSTDSTTVDADVTITQDTQI